MLYRHIFGIIFLIGLVLSISPITAYSIEASHYNNDSDLDMLTQVNHMEVMPLDNIRNKEKIKDNVTQDGVNQLGRIHVYEIVEYIVHIIGTLMMIGAIIIVMRYIHLEIPPTPFKLCFVLSLGMSGAALKCIF
jgi:hypothetical protein